MRTVVVYESMFGNTHHVAEQIAAAAAGSGEVTLVPVAEATPEVLAGADLVFVGGPTHVHGLSRPTTRANAAQMAEKDDDLHLDPDAEGPGVREWFDGLATVSGVKAAAFDTRADASAVLTGRASKGIAKRLRNHGFTLVAEPESFLVDKHNHLLEGEDKRALDWARAVVDQAIRG